MTRDFPPLPNPVPLCPNCGKPPWRDNHLAIFAERAEIAEGQFMVCMWCSAIRKMAAGRWIEVPESEREEVVKTLGPIALRFAMHRALGIEPEVIDRLLRAKRGESTG
jgi:hypothetical protein